MRQPLTARLRDSEAAWCWALFAACLLLLLAWAPGSNRWMGYSQEENAAALAVVDRLTGDATPGAPPSLFTRHGFVPVLLKLPYAAAARLFAGAPGAATRSPIEEGILALEPQVTTAALVALFALWVARATDSRRGALAVAFAALLATPLWPYAYVGLETSQALLLFVAALLAIGPVSPPRRGRTVLLIAALALAGSVKTTSLFLFPLLLWLAARAEHRRRLARPELGGSLLPWAIGALLAVRLASYAAVASYRASTPLFPGKSLVEAWRVHLVDSPLDFLVQLHGFLFSLNKGWLVFAPLALAGLVSAAIGRPAGGADVRRLALGSFVCLALPHAAMVFWAEETWGPRYLHAALAPALLALALARAQATPAPRRHPRWLLTLALAGLVVNALGASVHYGALYKATLAAGENSLEVLQYDPRWNHPRFNAWVLGEWARAPRDVANRSHPFPLGRHWWWTDAEPTPRAGGSVDLTPLIRPQPLALRVLVGGEAPALRPIAGLQLAFGALGLGVLHLLRRAALAGASKR